MKEPLTAGDALAGIVVVMVLILALLLTVSEIREASYNNLCRYLGYDYADAFFFSPMNCVRTITVPLEELTEGEP